MYGIKTTAFLSSFAARIGRDVARFILAVLLLNLLSTAALSASSRPQKNEDILPGAQTIIICTPQGLKYIALDKNGTPRPDKESGPAHCIFCLTFHKVVADIAVTEIAVPVASPITAQPRFARYLSKIGDEPLDVTRPPRAPPFPKL